LSELRERQGVKLRCLHAVLVVLFGCAGAMGVVADDEPDQPEQSDVPTALARQASAGPAIRGLARARLRGDGAVVFSEHVSGTGTISATDIIIEGTVAPGDSPGCINFGGNVTFNAAALLLIEIGGLTPCTEYDRIAVTNQLTVNGATLAIMPLDFTPAFGDRFDILDFGSFSGSFGTVDISAASLPPPLAWDMSQLYLSGEIAVGVEQYTDGDLAPWNAPNGVIDVGDILIAAQLALGLRSAGALQYAHGDMNTDGVIDITDLLLIQQLVLQ
jgi:hypothetical protein